MMATAGQRGARSTPGPFVRAWRAFRALSSDQRLCGLAALCLFVTMFFPWYDVAGIGPKDSTATQSAFGAFSVIEANVLIFSLGVLALLFARGEQRPLRMPGGDGTVIFGAGVWLVVVIAYRMFDKQGTSSVGGHVAITTSLDWGIFLALLASIWLAFTGRALRRSQRADDGDGGDGGETAYVPERRLRPLTRAGQQAAPPNRGAPPPAHDTEQLTFELPHDHYDE